MPIRKILALSFFLLFSLSLFAQSKSRHFVFDYSFTVRNTDPGKPLAVWFPIPQSDHFQKIAVLSKSGDLPLEETREAEYGNRMFYAHTEKADKAEYHFSVKYDVVRYEHLAALAERSQASQKELKRFLQPDKLVPVTGRPAEIAAQQVKPGMSRVEEARSLYDYTFANMKYDKSGTGWGHGDTLWACDSKRGNCTDFHSLFISMARSQHIPARFEIGFSVPEGQNSAEIAGYHCWAEFYSPERGWFPVDISEGWKHQEKKDYFFGAHDVNRIQFTVGRDVELSPEQQDTRLNYFVFPYVELDGKAYPNIANAFSFSDVADSKQARKDLPSAVGR
ncbi:MAG TPA: transglutaminase-like domain-containing protein [Candidatus Angelobacter sp.]|nr:transglutaminase-like domain-containing protein [Candidatus Angelobacter sp.]